jgi:molybdopterin converting factor small subunit
MRISVVFYSYFRELTGCPNVSLELPDGAAIVQLIGSLQERFPKLKAMEKSTLIAVGVEYQPRDHVLHDGDEVSLFPPVQGG